jgi:hypothetical protein
MPMRPVRVHRLVRVLVMPVMRLVVFVALFVALFMTVRVFVRRSVLMRMFMAMFMTFRMAVRVLVVRVRLLCRSIADEHIDLGAGDAAAQHLAPFQTRTHIERSHSFFEPLKGHARIHKGAQQHVAADARKTFKVRNSHGL